MRPIGVTVGLVEWDNQLMKQTRKSGCTIYAIYGCYRGPGGMGQPVDETDTQVRVHNLCDIWVLLWSWWNGTTS